MISLLQRLGWLPLAFGAGLLFYAASDLPTMGDPNSPPAVHVSPRYIEKAEEEAGAVNMVTAVLADYRSYDTLGETVVIFTAGLACVLVLGAVRGPSDEEDDQMTYSFGSDVLDVTSRILTPFMVLFAAYVVVHGHTSPGGGFQAGAILAAALILLRLVRGRTRSFELPPGALVKIASVGVLVYAGIGVVALFGARNFLDYQALPLPFEGGHLREVGSLSVEVGVFFAVTAVLVLIFESLTSGAGE